jgi:hypothetical protein
VDIWKYKTFQYISLYNDLWYLFCVTFLKSQDYTANKQTFIKFRVIVSLSLSHTHIYSSGLGKSKENKGVCVCVCVCVYKGYCNKVCYFFLQPCKLSYMPTSHITLSSAAVSLLWTLIIINVWQIRKMVAFWGSAYWNLQGWARA